jgi:hypothetical protein
LSFIDNDFSVIDLVQKEPKFSRSKCEKFPSSHHIISKSFGFLREGVQI